MSDRLRRYYEHFDEWARLETPSGRLEWLRAIEVVDRWLPPGSAVLDLGGGPGRLAIRLARAGHRVVLADLSPRLVAEARLRANEADVVLDTVEADARDLSRWATASFDVVLAFGPFYHLTDPADRVVAVEQIARVVRPGGRLLAQVIPRLSGVQGLFERASVVPRQVGVGAIMRALADGSS